MTLLDANGVVIPEPSAKIPTFSMKLAAEVALKSLALDDYTKGAKTGVTITYTTMNRMEPYSVIVLGYPLTANFQQGIDIACAVTVSGYAFASLCKLDRLKREVVFTLYSRIGVATPLGTTPAGTEVTLVVKDFVNDAMYGQMSADTFTLRSYSDKTRQSLIDKISDGLRLFSCEEGSFFDGTLDCLSCLAPCHTCSYPGSVCLSCD